MTYFVQGFQAGQKRSMPEPWQISSCLEDQITIAGDDGDVLSAEFGLGGDVSRIAIGQKEIGDDLQRSFPFHRLAK